MATTKPSDNRPYEVYNTMDESEKVRRCWYEETAQKLAKIMGKQYAYRERFPASSTSEKKRPKPKPKKGKSK